MESTPEKRIQDLRPTSPTMEMMSGKSSRKVELLRLEAPTADDVTMFEDPVYESPWEEDGVALPQYNVFCSAASRKEKSFAILKRSVTVQDGKHSQTDVKFEHAIAQDIESRFEVDTGGIELPVEEVGIINDSGLHGDFPDVSDTSEDCHNEGAVSENQAGKRKLRSGRRMHNNLEYSLRKRNLYKDGSESDSETEADSTSSHLAINRRKRRKASGTKIVSSSDDEHEIDPDFSEPPCDSSTDIETTSDSASEQDTNPTRQQPVESASAGQSMIFSNELKCANEVKDTEQAKNKSKAPVITIPKMRKNEHGDRLYDKAHVCYFCNMQCLKIARHLFSVHKHEKEVMEIEAISQNTAEGRKRRKQEIDRLRNKGNFYHNLKVLKIGGELKVGRRPGANEDCNPSIFSPCTHCLVFVRKQDLWRHSKTCPFNDKCTDSDEPAVHRKLQYESEMLLYANKIPTGCSPELSSLILSVMKNDEISRTVKNDRLILLVGSSLLEKGGTNTFTYISQRMRTLARLLLEVQSLKGNDEVTLSDIISPDWFDTIVEATRSLCLYRSLKKDENSSFGKPGLALNIGYDIKKASILLRGQGLRNKDTKVLNNISSFLQLFELEWRNHISTSAIRSLSDRKFNKPEVLPLTSDLLKVRDYINKELKSAMTKLAREPAVQNWRHLAEIVAARIIIFNKRRGNEGTKMTISEFQNRPKWSQHQLEDVVSSLQPLEQELCKRLDLVHVRGKRGNKVPIILTPETIGAIKMLIEQRAAAGVHEDNKYVFAAPTRGSLNYLRGPDCLSSVISKIGLENASAIKSTKLRKYVATVSQIVDLRDTELEWLARHMGHDVNIHKQYYRLPDHTIELSKISRLLLAVDEGNASKWAGKKLDDIDVNELPVEYETDDEELAKNEAVDHEEPELETEIDSTVDIGASNANAQNDKTRKKNTRTKKNPWTTAESTAALNYFERHIKQERLPRKAEVEKCLAENPVLKNRPWKILKDFIRNQITRAQRKRV